MGIRVSIHHKSDYIYDRLVTLSPQIVRLRPAPHSRTRVTSYSLTIEPRDHFINWQQDPNGNFLARLVFPKPTRLFSLEVSLVAEVAVMNPFDFFLEPQAETYPFSYDVDQVELQTYLTPTTAGPLLDDFVASIAREERKTIDFLVELNQRLQRDVRYLIRMEPGVQTPEQTLQKGSGSCRDSSWLLVQVLRRLGLAARFVSGYLVQLKADVKPLEGPAGPDEDFIDLHAWTEVYLPGAGWIGLDPTSGLLAAEGHIPLAATPDAQSASPVSGMVSECEVEFGHRMSVTRIHEDPRVTKPYTEMQWERLSALGDQVDHDLNAQDVRLTMGGEPTFVSVDDMDGDEWNTAATGPSKRAFGSALIHRLRDRFAPNGFLHFGQGKWYPGESLPRWAFACYWRSDGDSLWRDSRWLGDPTRDYGFGPTEARRFAETLSRQLGLAADYVIHAYEDPFAYALKERQLPVNVDPSDNKLDNPEERERLRRVFEQGLTRPVGFVLPIRRGIGKSGPEWQTGLWMLRSRHLFLVPGDSPAGFRLPLDSLSWEEPDQMQRVWLLDPMAPAPPLPATVRHQAHRDSSGPAIPAPQSVVRTALVVEPRDGKLWVFLPPASSAEECVDLINAIENTAAELGTPVMLEGYPPPFDSRLQTIKVTPDPGVIEVNVHPCASWRELIENTTTLYEEARQCRLGTEKFMLDGRHTGTGGGNHLVLGGRTPGDSPFLRRPDLLKSLLGYWNNNPALSYLFSGVFVGPTSQAPRVDETRADATYELELAFQLLAPASAGECPPWLVDRIFRNLLVDVTGNTHRAEFCIDKLYSPDSSTGRLGLVELRGFEMPPHARMSLAQQLLVRALIAWFWRMPYEQPLIRWGTRLHDMFLLPYHVESNFGDVLADLARAGYSFDSAWFAPQIEFRFPTYGKVCYEGVELELRQAIEPWDVLGEEPGAGGTARYVDSSVERLQVRVKGLISERFAILCNGRRLPLHPTGTHGEFVCGVRYRAWQPPRCLHPTIPIHSPLTLEIVDASARRSVGGCTYHVMHPGGRTYETFPVNSNEAEARRNARFFAFGHTPGQVEAPPVEVNPEFPLTLDLRRSPAAAQRQAHNSR